MEKHWKWSRHTIGSLALDLRSAPQLRSVSNWREVVGDELRAPAAVRIGGSGRAVTLSQIEMDDEMVARLHRWRKAVIEKVASTQFNSVEELLRGPDPKGRLAGCFFASLASWSVKSCWLMSRFSKTGSMLDWFAVVVVVLW